MRIGTVKFALLLALSMLLLVSFESQPETIIAQDDAAKIRKDIQKAEETITKLEQERQDAESEEKSNLESQEDAEGDVLAKLKKKAAEIASELNTLRDKINKQSLYIDERKAALRNAARKEAKSHLSDAEKEAKKNDKRKTRDALLSAKSEIRDWTREATKGSKLYKHLESAKLRGTGAIQKAEAKSERTDLKTGLKLLKGEEARLEKELDDIDDMSSGGAKAKLLPKEWKEIKKLLDTLEDELDDRNDNVETRIEDYEARLKKLNDFIGS